jgi:DNA-binding response OmpR family regulator
MRILLMEDEPRIRALDVRGLGAEGLTVDDTDDGRFLSARAVTRLR